MNRQAKTRSSSFNVELFLLSILPSSILLGIVVSGLIFWYGEPILGATVASATVGIIVVFIFFVSSLRSSGGNRSMNNQNPGPSPAEKLGNRLISMLVMCIVVGITFTLLFIWLEELMLAGIVGTATVALFLTLIVSIASLFSSHRTMKILREGAEIAIDAMGDNGKYDAQMTKVFGSIFAQGAKMSASQRPALYPANGQQQGMPALPLPSQDFENWMPPVTTMTIDADQQDSIFEDPANMGPLD